MARCWTRALDLIGPSVNPTDKEQQIWFCPSKEKKNKKKNKKNVCLLSPDYVTV